MRHVKGWRKQICGIFIPFVKWRGFYLRRRQRLIEKKAALIGRHFAY